MLTIPMEVQYAMWVMGILQLLDAWTTYMALKTNPNVEEGNPAIAWFLKKFGLLGGLLFKLILAGGVIFWMHMQTSVDPLLYVVMAIYVYVVWNNYKFIRK